jgi:hypothetical protein
MVVHWPDPQRVGAGPEGQFHPRHESAPGTDPIVLGERERAIGLPASAGLQGTFSQSIIEVGTSEQVQPVICSQLKLSGCIVFLVGSGRPEPFWVAGSTCGAQERLELSLRKSRVRPEWAMCHRQCTRGHRSPDGRISREATAGLAGGEVNLLLPRRES